MGIGAAAVLIASGVIVSPAVRDRLREEWWLRELAHARDVETRRKAAAQLARMSSKRAVVPLIRMAMAEEASPTAYYESVFIILGHYGPQVLGPAIEIAIERGEIDPDAILRLANSGSRSLHAMFADVTGKAGPCPSCPEEVRTMEDVNRVLACWRSFMEMVH